MYVRANEVETTGGPFIICRMRYCNCGRTILVAACGTSFGAAFLKCEAVKLRGGVGGLSLNFFAQFLVLLAGAIAECGGGG